MIIAVLLVIVILSLAAYQFTEVMSSEYRAAARTLDTAQARLCAVSGIYYAAGMLADRDAYINQLGGNPFDNPGVFMDVVCHPSPDNPRREGRFSLVTVASPSPGLYETQYGVADEAAKLNINTLIQLDPTGQQLHDALMMLPGMTEDVADAIVDWVDADDDVRPSGAESSYYTALATPYRAKNGPLNSLDELLLVKGVTPQLLYGNDRNRNGIADDSPEAGQLDRGWTDYLTVYGRELNADSTGAARVYLNQDDMATLYQQLNQAVGSEMATYILAYKLFSSVTNNVSQTSTSSTSSGGATVTVTVSGSGGGGSMTVSGTSSGGSGGSGGQSQATSQPASFDQLAEAVNTLLQSGATSRRQIRNSVLALRNTRVTLPTQQQSGQQGQQGQQQITYYFDSPLMDPAKLNELLPTLMDKVTARADIEMPPRININTAPREVLLAIPNMTETDADNILAQREAQNKTDPAYFTGAWVVTAAGMNPDTFRRIERYITGRTMVYRVQSIGYFAEGGPVARVEAVIDINQGAPRVLYFRDLTDLDNPRGFEPPRR